MNIKEIKELMDMMDKSCLTFLEYEKDGEMIVLSKEVNTVANNVAPQGQVTSQISPEQGTTVLKENAENIEVETEGTFIKSPIVGTYYSAQDPKAPPFVKVGDKVKKGQILCIIEAMKLMNEITAEADGEIVEIFAINEQMVEFGQNLFKVK